MIVLRYTSTTHAADQVPSVSFATLQGGIRCALGLAGRGMALDVDRFAAQRPCAGFCPQSAPQTAQNSIFRTAIS